MELFQAAGIELPSGSGGGARRRLPRPRAAPLFAAKVIDKAIRLAALNPTAEQLAAARDYARLARSAGFAKQQESRVRQIFYDKVLGAILGYSRYDPEAEYTLEDERRTRGGSVDMALGRFSDKGTSEVAAPLEMKGPDTADLDAVMPGRGKSPVQQAWEYAVDTPGAKWVLVSNCLEIRLYRFGRGRDSFETFDLRRLDAPEVHGRLALILEAKRFLTGDTDALLSETDSAYRQVTDDLYAQYGKLRSDLIAFTTEAAEGPRLDRRKAIETVQKLLDRVLFIAFVGGIGLTPPKLLEAALKERNRFEPKPVWSNFQNLFRFMDEGSDQFGISGFNGGLFAFDPVLDSLLLPDHLADAVAALGQWDFGREVPVTVLGHIFEQSIADLEKLRAETRGEAPPKVGKRKREGVVYTPDHITRFVVECTLGATMAERFAALLDEHTGTRALPKADEPSPWANEAAERDFWRAYLESLRALTVIDPACGSGAFLVAAFDALAAEYARAIERLEALGDKVEGDAFDDILTRNLHGVDLNVESVEITRLSLWLKTARRQHRLASLDETIRDGDSLIGDKRFAARPFAWDGRFAEIAGRGGFDVVIGNPPYVRMELLKPIKPHLTERYTVADERTDLYAYFFEKGVNLLRPGGRLGFISSSTFFRTGSGEKLRLLLSERAAIETVIDFGDAQLFEGVTTYPAIVALRKLAPGDAPTGDLRFLKVAGATPADLGAAFTVAALPMPRSRLTGASWQFEEDHLARLRDKIVKGRKTLGEVYGPPLRGIVTGLNDAFVIDRAIRDRLVARDPKSAELLKPFLRGENIKRWRVEPEGLFLINIPKGKVSIDDYPAIRDHLLPFRAALEKRATQQEWFELQQAQLAYQSLFAATKISYPHFQNKRMFTLEPRGFFSNDKSYAIPHDDFVLLAYLNSKAAWSFITSISPAVRNHWHEMRVQYLELIPIPAWSKRHLRELVQLAESSTNAAHAKYEVIVSVKTRIAIDLGGGRRLSRKLEDWHALGFTEFRTEVKRALRCEIPVKEREQWERYLAENGAKVRSLKAAIEAAEREIDALVYDAFDLTKDEISLLEAAIAGQA